MPSEEIDFTIELKIVAREIEGASPAEVTLSFDAGTGKTDPSGVGGGHAGTLTFPSRGFPDAESRTEWIQKAFSLFTVYLGHALTHEAFLLFVDAGNLAAETMGFDTDPVGRNELVKIHLKQTEQRVSNFMRARGQRSKWTAAGLERAVRAALRSLPRKSRGLDEVAAALRETYPKQAPVSGPALGKMLERFGIDWMKIKTDS
jgi:hypothetical protein